MRPNTNHGENNINNIKNLTETYKIKSENIDRSAYFLSLTDNAFNAGLLTEKDMENIQSQIYDILSDNIWMYTGGTSTSVTTKEANELMLAILAVLDSFCISEVTDDKKLNGLIKIFKEKAAVKKCYEKGLEFMKIKSAKEIAVNKMAGEVRETLDSYENFYDADEFADFEEEFMTENNIISQSVLTDIEFNMLCVKIAKCKTAGAKADLIIESVSSVNDFLDLLNSQCLFDKDYLVLYEKLLTESTETIAFLVKTILSGGGFYHFDIRAINSLADKIDESAEEWQQYLTKFILELSEKDKKIIIDIIQNS